MNIKTRPFFSFLLVDSSHVEIVFFNIKKFNEHELKSVKRKWFQTVFTEPEIFSQTYIS